VDNLLVGFEDPSVLEDYTEQQETDPAPFKHLAIQYSNPALTSAAQ
jgi:hypothetical protein